MLLFLISIILLIYVSKYFNKQKNNQISNWLDVYNELDSKDEPQWRRFEREVALLFEQNWREVKLWPWSDDDWKDIVIKKELKIYLVQCKHYYWNWFVWPKEIRDFQWAIDIYKRKNNLNVWWIFITSWKTSKKARETARILDIELWNKRDWRDKINNF